MELTPHIHALKINFQVPIAPGRALDRFVYSYLIYGPEICLIDSGVAGAERIILADLEKTARRPEEISTMILSHSHPDHIGAAAAMSRASACKVAAHRAEKAWIEDVELQCRQRPVPGFQTLVAGPVIVDRLLEEGDIVHLGQDLALEVFHTPGHSSGSISLLLRGEVTALFSADAIPLPGDLPIYEDAEALVASVKKLQAIKGVDLLLSAWDEPRLGEEVGRTMSRALSHLRHIHETVLKAAAGETAPEPMALCAKVVSELGLPPAAVNPLVARSFMANLAWSRKKSL